MTMRKFRFVVVTWVDSRQPTTAWQWLSKYECKPVRCVTSGWLVRDDDECKAVCQTFGDIDDDDGDVQAMGVTLIPSRAVVKMEDVVIPAEAAE